MDFTVRAKKVNVGSDRYSNAGSFVSVELEGVHDNDVGDILDVIGKAQVLDHFGIEEKE